MVLGEAAQRVWMASDAVAPVVMMSSISSMFLPEMCGHRRVSPSVPAML